MIDYNPSIVEHKREARYTPTAIEKKENSKEYNILKQYENDSASNVMNTIYDISKQKINNNYDIDDIEDKYFGDVFGYKAQNERIQSIIKDLNAVSDSISVMLYGEVISIDEAKKRDSELFVAIKNNGEVNNTNLYYLARILNVVNNYISDCDKHIESINLLNNSVYNFTSNDSRMLLINNDEIECLHIESMNALNDQLVSANFVSDNFVVNNYLKKVYNHFVDYNTAVNALKSLNSDDGYSILKEKENNIINSLNELIKVIEYSKLQSSNFELLLYSRIELLKSFYNTK